MSAGGMRIERRGESEVLVGCPRAVDGRDKCDATLDGWICSVHFNGEHIATVVPDRDGHREICARWPIDRATAPAPPPPRPAEEIAREMVRTWARSNDIGLKITLEIRDGTGRAFVDVETEGEVDDMRALITRLIEQSRADGAAAERERLAMSLAATASDLDRWASSVENMADTSGVRAAELRMFSSGLTEAARRIRWFCGAPAAQPITITLHPAPDVPGQWVAHHAQRDLMSQGNSETHALRMIAEAIEIVDGAAQPATLADAIRALLMTWTGRHFDALAKAAPPTAPVGARDEAVSIGYAADDLLAAFFDATTNGRVARHRVRDMRESENVWQRQAASDLEAIIREHGKDGA